MPIIEQPARNRLLRELAGFALFFVLALLAVGLLRATLDPSRGGVRAVPILSAELVLLLLVVAFVAFLQRRRGDRLSDLGFRPGPGTWQQVLTIGAGQGLLIKLATIPVGLVAFLLGARGAALDLRMDGAFDLLGFVLTGSVAAVLEELAFRGFLRDRVARLFGESPQRPRLATTGVVTSVLFSLGHGYEGLLGLIVTAFVGLLLFRLATTPGRGLAHAIVAHAMFNTTSFVFVALAAR